MHWLFSFVNTVQGQLYCMYFVSVTFLISNLVSNFSFFFTVSKHRMIDVLSLTQKSCIILLYVLHWPDFFYYFEVFFFLFLFRNIITNHSVLLYVIAFSYYFTKVHSALQICLFVYFCSLKVAFWLLTHTQELQQTLLVRNDKLQPGSIHLRCIICRDLDADCLIQMSIFIGPVMSRHLILNHFRFWLNTGLPSKSIPLLLNSVWKSPLRFG